MQNRPAMAARRACVRTTETFAGSGPGKKRGKLPILENNKIRRSSGGRKRPWSEFDVSHMEFLSPIADLLPRQENGSLECLASAAPAEVREGLYFRRPLSSDI